MNEILSILLNFILKSEPKKVYEMRITGYHVMAQQKGALGEIVYPGKNGAVSPACIDLLGEKIYIKGHGILKINDITSNEIDEKFGICTIDLAKGTKKEAKEIGANICTVVHLPCNKK